MRTTPETAVRPLVRHRTVNATDTSFPSKVPTATKPSGTGASASAASVAETKGASNLRVVPFGAGSDTNTFSLRVIGWKFVGTPGSDELWVPTVLAEYSCALTTAVGVAAKAVLDTERFCDTLTLTANMGNDGVDTTKFSPGGDLVAHFLVDLKGSDLFELTFDMTGATSGNALTQLL